MSLGMTFGKDKVGSAVTGKLVDFLNFLAVVKKRLALRKGLKKFKVVQGSRSKANGQGPKYLKQL